MRVLRKFFFFCFSTSFRSSKNPLWREYPNPRQVAGNWPVFIFLPISRDHFSPFVRGDRTTRTNTRARSNPSALFSHTRKGENETALFNSWISGIAWARKIVYKLLRLTEQGLYGYFDSDICPRVKMLSLRDTSEMDQITNHRQWIFYFTRTYI